MIGFALYLKSLNIRLKSTCFQINRYTVKPISISVLIMFLCVLPLFVWTADATPTLSPQEQQSAIVVDHNSVEMFEQIPEQYIQAAATLDMLFMDRSVGGNINDGLTCLSYESDEVAPSHCKRYEHVDPRYSVDPTEVNWSRAGGYDRSNWEFQYWPTNLNCASWSDKVDCFIDYIEPVIDGYDVVSFQFSYLAVDEDSSIADQPGGFFSDNTSLTDVYDFEDFEGRNPAKKTIYWTTSLSRGIGTTVSESFNDQMRQYASTNGKMLFDVADILSHDPDGNPCYDNRDGVPYDNGNNSENYPDDGNDIPAICPEYTTEVDGGHLGSVSAGKIRVAKAFWVLMAHIAGWNGSSTTPSVQMISRLPSLVDPGSSDNMWFSTLFPDIQLDPGTPLRFIAYLHVPEDWQLPWATQYSFDGSFAQSTLSRSFDPLSWITNPGNCSEVSGQAAPGYKWRAFVGPNETMPLSIGGSMAIVSLKGGLEIPSLPDESQYPDIRIVTATEIDSNLDGDFETIECRGALVSTVGISNLP